MQESQPVEPEIFWAKSIVKLTNGITAYRLVQPNGPQSRDFSDSPMTIVCLHGMNDSSWIWADLVEVLSDSECGPGAQVLIFDFYGRGNSPWCGVPCTLNTMVTQLLELLDFLRIMEPVSFIGHCMGGAVAVGFAAKYPERTASLCLLSTLGVRINQSLSDRMLKLRFCCLGEYIMLRRKKQLPKLVERGYHNKDKDAEHREVIDKQIRMVEWQIKNTPGYVGALLSTYRTFPLKGTVLLFMRSIVMMFIFNAAVYLVYLVYLTAGMHELFDLVGKHARPVLVICGDNDVICPFDRVIDELTGSFPRATITRLDKCGHNPMVEKFFDVATLVVDFHLDMKDPELKKKSISLRVADRNYLRGVEEKK